MESSLGKESGVAEGRADVILTPAGYQLPLGSLLLAGVYASASVRTSGGCRLSCASAILAEWRANRGPEQRPTKQRGRRSGDRERHIVGQYFASVLGDQDVLFE